MREIRLPGSEGGALVTNVPTPYPSAGLEKSVRFRSLSVAGLVEYELFVRVH